MLLIASSRRVATAIGCVVALLLGLGAPLPSRADDPVAFSPDDLDFFESKIRPILVDNCVECHNANKSNSSLRLDSRAGLLKGGDLEGPSVYLDEPDASPLLLVIRHELDNLAMPPKKPKLEPDQIAALEEWVRRGLPWTPDALLPTPGGDPTKDHWAFQPVQRPDLPTVNQSAWVASPVDAFILARLEAANLQPSPVADRATLIRRASYDLIGLPPTYEEVAAFVDDPRSDIDAFAALVDRLLASPHYGERWGRHWLDVSRYADSKGYVFQEERRYPYAYTYRDYVVQSFNADKPYNQFILEQIAADQLERGDDQSSLAAMGFLTLGRRFLNNQNDIIDDRIDVVTRGLLGLTVACARCHDHKYDPIPAADYYAMHGVFASSVEPGELPQIGEAEPGPEHDAYLAELDKRRNDVKNGIVEIRNAIRDELRKKPGALFQAALEIELDPRSGKAEDVARAHEIDPPRLRFFTERLAALVKTAGPDDPVLGPWAAFSGPSEGFAERAAQVLERATAPESAWTNPLLAEIVLASPPPATIAEVADRYGKLVAETIARPEDAPGRADLLAWIDQETSPFQPPDNVEQTRLINRAEREKIRGLERKVDELQATHPGAPPRAMVLNDSDKPQDSYVFLRGNPGNRGPDVPRQFLKLIAGEDRKPFSQGSGRLELAQAIADPSNPLTSRVLVNRVWMHHYVHPLVRTPSDFGVRSEPPSHPELLDWLASEFVANGWSIKHLHRLLMVSNTYMQQSFDRPDTVQVDPENRLLWRQNRRRLEFEALRDGLLAASGRLDRRAGGRPAPSPADPNGTRRTLYSFIDRQNLEGVYRTFDFASPDSSSPGRHRTTVPQQALFLMNSEFMARQAITLADSAEQTAGPSAIDDQIRALHRAIYGREPADHELDLGRRYLAAAHETKGPPPPTWRFGLGRLNEAGNQLAAFEPLRHWTGDAWQFARKYPHDEARYLRLTATGGHAGPSAQFLAVRRWTAPADGLVRVEGNLEHTNEQGDGVRARVLTAPDRILGEWTAHNAQAATSIEPIQVRAGDTLDFVIDPLTNDGWDGYAWAPVVRFFDSPESPDPTASFDSRQGFQGPGPEPLQPLERYAQVLLMTNEFQFVD